MLYLINSLRPLVVVPIIVVLTLLVTGSDRAALIALGVSAAFFIFKPRR